MRAIGAFLIDLAAWFALPGAFLALYIGRYGAPAAAAPAHLRVAVLPLLALAVLRFFLGRISPRPVARVISAGAGAAVLGTTIAYYALVIAGLDAWGRVVSWDLITTYGNQLGMLTDALGVSVGACLVAILAAYIGMAATLWLYFGRWDWAPEAARRASAPLFGLLMAGACLGLAAEVYKFAIGTTGAEEPLTLTMRPLESARDMQGHAIDVLRAHALDDAEDHARAAYRPAKRAPRSNVVLIVVDALRLDHMGLFGYTRETT